MTKDRVKYLLEQRGVGQMIGEKSIESITLSDVERSLILEKRIVSMRMKALKRAKRKLTRMYDLDAQDERNTYYRPHEWQYDRREMYQSSHPKIFHDKYNPKRKRDSPVVAKPTK